jgi:aspartate/methionine/tyrosine aminotransferase
MERKGSSLVERLSGDERSKGFPRVQGDVVKLHIGDPDFSTPEHICEAAIKAIKDGYTHYAPPGGYLELREGICRRLYEDKGIQKNPEEILVTNGASEGIFLCLSALLSPGDEVLILNPCYSLYATVAKMLGSVPIFVQLGADLKVTRAGVEKHLSSRSKMVIVNNPCNPTARVFSRKEMTVIAEIAYERGLLVLSDEVYHRITYDGRKHFSINELREVEKVSILVDSLSKTYAMTGWRIGYVAGCAKWIEWMKMVHKAVNNTLNSIAQKAAIAAVFGPQECVELMRGEYERRKKVVEDETKKIPGISTFPIEGTFYVFCRYRPFLKSVEMAEYLLRNGVSVRSGSEFGPQGEGCFRLSFTCQEGTIRNGIKRIREALLELSDFLKK